MRQISEKALAFRTFIGMNLKGDDLHQHSPSIALSSVNKGGVKKQRYGDIGHKESSSE